MNVEQEVVAAIARTLLSQPDALQRRQLVAVLSMPSTAVGREFKNALRDELKKRKQAAQSKNTAR